MCCIWCGQASVEIVGVGWPSVLETPHVLWTGARHGRQCPPSLLTRSKAIGIADIVEEEIVGPNVTMSWTRRGPLGRDLSWRRRGLLPGAKGLGGDVEEDRYSFFEEFAVFLSL